MSTLQWRRCKTGLIVFAFASLPILWVLWKLAGRSLSLTEILGGIGGVAMIVAAFTWAFGSDPREEPTPDTAGALDPISAAKLPSAVPTVGKPRSVIASEAWPLVATSTATLAKSPRATAVGPASEIAARPYHDTRQPERGERSPSAVASQQAPSVAASPALPGRPTRPTAKAQRTVAAQTQTGPNVIAAQSTIWNGEPGTVWTNDTGQVKYQFICALNDTCGFCLQYHLAIGFAWGIPFHHGCRCKQKAIQPGAEAPHPFVNFRELLDDMPHHEQVAAIGAGNYKLLKEGLAGWDEIVTPTRVRDLQEVVAIKKLTVQEMLDAGIEPRVAQEAHAAVHTPEHELVERHRRELIDKIKVAGLNRDDLVSRIASRLAERVTGAGGPIPTGTTTQLDRAIPLAARIPMDDVWQAGIIGMHVEATDRNQTVRHENIPRRAKQLRWFGRGETVTVGAYPLRDPMVYVSDGQLQKDEASCIDSSLDVGKPVWEPTGSLGYYPTYANLSPDQRANYLRWLSSGRVEPLHDIGYAFLFFYGLERRLLVEQQDLSAVVKEVVRLLETQTLSGSFDGYLSRFLAFTLARVGIETLKDKWFEAVFDKSRLQRDTDFLAVALAWFFKKNAPLPATWAMRIARQDPRSPRSVVLDRLPEQFMSLFEKRYREQFAGGLFLKASKRDRSISYRPASPSFLFDVNLSKGATEPIKIPDVLGIQSQFSPLATIWASCIEELKPLSRVVGKGIEVNTREAFEALPDDLKAKVEHPDKEKWDRMVAEHTGEGGCALVQISKLATIHGQEERAKLTPKQSQALAQTAEYVGLVMEPDARLTNRPYNWEEVVSLLRPEGKPGLPTDSRYLAASLMLELGIYIAGADGSVEDVEVDQVARFLESQFLLDPPDARRLAALKRVFMARPPSLAGLGKRLQTALTREQREAVGRFLTGIAAANGIIDRKEVTALRNAYRALDIGVDQLNGLLEEFRRASQEPVEIQSGEQFSEQGETIPARPQAKTESGFTLDEGLLRRLMAETQAVAKMLGEAMRDENIAEEGEDRPTVPVVPLKESRFASLDIRFHSMLSRLLTRPVWCRAEFDSLAREFKLMPDGTLDAINDWSVGAFDDSIIVDQGGELEIQSQLLESRP